MDLVLSLPPPSTPVTLLPATGEDLRVVNEPLILNIMHFATMPAALARHYHIWTARFLSPASRRSISSLSHFTPAEPGLYGEYEDRKARRPPSPIPQEQIEPEFLQSHICNRDSSVWVVADNKAQGLERGSVLKVASWNLDWFSPGPAVRASAALAHLMDIFGESPGHHVVMLQEVCDESLQAILDNTWVRRNFVLSNINPPETLWKDICGESFILKQKKWQAAGYFTLMMISKTLPISNCFRVPFITSMGRDALVVDIPILHSGGLSNANGSLRLCTTHLESLWGGGGYRHGQLALISSLLKGASGPVNTVIGGMVGGDMNAIDRSEHDYPKATGVDLNDVWEDVPAPSRPVRKPFQKDLSYGRARGNTWGYQSSKKQGGKRMDKFLYTGSIETLAVDEAQDTTGKLGRFGIGLKTEVEAWETDKEECRVVKGELVNKICKHYLSERQVSRLPDRLRSSLTRTKIDAWVSDHFGITVGIRIP